MPSTVCGSSSQPEPWSTWFILLSLQTKTAVAFAVLQMRPQFNWHDWPASQDATGIDKMAISLAMFTSLFSLQFLASALGVCFLVQNSLQPEAKSTADLNSLFLLCLVDPWHWQRSPLEPHCWHNLSLKHSKVYFLSPACENSTQRHAFPLPVSL